MAKTPAIPVHPFSQILDIRSCASHCILGWTPSLCRHPLCCNQPVALVLVKHCNWLRCVTTCVIITERMYILEWRLHHLASNDAKDHLFDQRHSKHFETILSLSSNLEWEPQEKFTLKSSAKALSPQSRWSVALPRPKGCGGRFWAEHELWFQMLRFWEPGHWWFNKPIQHSTMAGRSDSQCLHQLSWQSNSKWFGFWD